MSPDFDELVGNDATGAERARLREAHELLLRAGPPPELTPKLKAGPNPGTVRKLERRRVVKRRSLVLLAAALSIVVVFFAGYAVSSHRGGGNSSSTGIVQTISLQGTSSAHDAQATLDVWRERDGGREVVFDPLFPKGTPLPAPGENSIEIRRKYEPVHNIGGDLVTHVADECGDGKSGYRVAPGLDKGYGDQPGQRPGR